MDYNVFLDYNNTTVRIPVLPEELDIKNDSNNDTKNILGLGDINLLKDVKLREISFKSFFPISLNPYVVVKNKLPSPSFYIDFINNIRKSKKPARLVLTGLYDINMLVSIEKFSTTEKGGEPGDVYYDISFKEYREYKSIELDIKSNINKQIIEEKVIRPSKEPSKTYIVKSGDSLWRIAKKELGDGSKWSELASINNIKPEYIIHPGQEIKLC